MTPEETALHERIRELCIRVVKTEGSEFETTLAELANALAELANAIELANRPER